MQGLVKTLSVLFSGYWRVLKQSTPTWLQHETWNGPVTLQGRSSFLFSYSIYYLLYITFHAPSSFPFSKKRSAIKKRHTSFATGCLLYPSFLLGNLLIISFQRVYSHSCPSRGRRFYHCIACPYFHPRWKRSFLGLLIWDTLILVFFFLLGLEIWGPVFLQGRVWNWCSWGHIDERLGTQGRRNTEYSCL